MNKLLVLLLLTVAMTSGQRLRGSGSGGGIGKLAQGGAQSSLQAGEENLDSEQLLLQAKEKKEAKLAKRAAKKERKRRRKAAREAAKIKAAESLDYETYDNKAAESNLDAAAKKDSSNRFGLQIISENDNKEQAQIRANDRAVANSGTRLASDSLLDAAQETNQLEEEEFDFLDENQLEAADASDAAINAELADIKKNKAFIDQEEVARNRIEGQNTGLFSVFGNNDPFSNFGFRRR